MSDVDDRIELAKILFLIVTCMNPFFLAALLFIWGVTGENPFKRFLE